MARIAMALSCTLLACGSGSPELPTCEIEPVTAGTLRAVGTRVVDSHDRIVFLRGANAGGRSKFAPYQPFEPAYLGGDRDAALADYLDRAAAWGVDVLRVPFSWQAVEPDAGRYDQDFLARYDALIDGAWQRGIWTIVDFHQDVYAEGFCGDGFPAWTLADPPAPRHDCPDWFQAYSNDDRVRAAFDAFWANDGGVRDAFARMWSMLATRYASHPGVIGYEIMNEPSSGSASSAQWATDVLTPFYSELAGVIQDADPDALVLFDATGADGVIARTQLERPAGDNLIFAPHYYQPGALFGGGVAEDVLTPLSRWADQGADWQVPVLLGEFGVTADHDDAVPHMRRQMDALDQLAMHGTWWEYSISHELWNDEDLSVVDGDGVERPVLEALVRPYPRAVAGSEISLAYDSASRTLTLAYTPTAGTSEIVLPARLYPAGGHVGGSGACIARDGDRLRVRADAGTARVELTISPR